MPARATEDVGPNTAAPGQAWLPALHRPQLDARLLAQDRLFHAVHAAPFGIGIDARYHDEAALTALQAFATSGDAEALGAHVFTLIDGYGGPSGIGLRGASAALATAFRLIALRNEGADLPAVVQARKDALRALEAVHVAVAITGVPGRVARGIQRLVPEDAEAPPIPLDDLRELVPLFDSQGNPLPAEKNNGTPRADNSGGALPPGVWSWEDSCSKDQLIGWVTAMGALHDALANDPEVDASLMERLREDAKAVGAMLRETHEFQTLDGGTYSYDLVIMDADGRPTQHNDLHPSGLDGIWFPPESGVANPLNLVMSLGIITTLWHVSGDEALDEYLYAELYGKRGWLAAIPDSAEEFGVFAGAKTNFSGVNMAALGLYGALRYEADPQVRAKLQASLQGFFASSSEKRAGMWLKQPFFNALYMATRDGAMPPQLIETTADLLEAYVLGPYLAVPRVNCDEAELTAGVCEALDGSNLTLDPLPNRAGHPIATQALSPAIRPTSNFDARSDPFEVNDAGAERAMLPAGDILSAYWVLRALGPVADGDQQVSPLARPHQPVGGGPIVLPDPPDATESDADVNAVAEPHGDVGGVVADAGGQEPDAGGPAGADVGAEVGGALDVAPVADSGEGGCAVGSRRPPAGWSAALLAMLLAMLLAALRATPLLVARRRRPAAARRSARGGPCARL